MTDTMMDTLEASFETQDLGGVVTRPLLAGGGAMIGGGFNGFLRSGAIVELKAFTGLTGDAGGYAIPKEIDSVIDATLKAISPMRSIANVVKVGTAGYRKLVTTGGTPSGWAAETDLRPGTATPVFTEIAPGWRRITAAPVRAITRVETTAGVLLATTAYAIDVDAQGDGWVRVSDGGSGMRVVVFDSGLASDWTGLPGPVRQGAVLLAAHLFDTRERSAPPPLAVAALWRPFRRIALIAGTHAC